MQFTNFKDIPISKIGFGCAALSGEGGGYGFGPISSVEASRLVDMAMDIGINLFDNAPIYGFGQAELNLGLALAQKRQKAFIISKCGVNWHESGRVDMTNNPQKCLIQLEDSLKRLKTDYIDLYMIHWPDKRVPIEQTLAPLLKAKKNGKIRFLGLSNPIQSDIDKVPDKIDFIQAESNLFNSGYRDIDLNTFNKFFSMSWGTFDKGILSGSVRDNSTFDKSDCRSWAPWWKKSNWKIKVKTVKALHDYLDSQNIDKVHYMIQYNLIYKNISSVLCGLKKTAYLEDMKRVFEHEIDNEHFIFGEKLFQ
jgi:aryl-alcohol dehydrogenase-like predicted oxidoreductase